MNMDGNNDNDQNTDINAIDDAPDHRHGGDREQAPDRSPRCTIAELAELHRRRQPLAQHEGLREVPLEEISHASQWS